MVRRELSDFEVTKEGLVKRIIESLRDEIHSINKSLKYTGLFICGGYICSSAYSIGWEMGRLETQKTREDAVILAGSNIKKYSEMSFVGKMVHWQRYITNKGFLMVVNHLDDSMGDNSGKQ